MPRVPTYDAPSIRTNPVAGPQARAVLSAQDIAGSAPQVADTLARAGAVAARTMDTIEQRKFDRENADAVFRATVQMRSKALDYEAEQRKTRKGAFAKGVVEDLDSWHQDTASEIAETLVNDEQRKLFEQQSYRVWERNRAALGRFQEAELERSHQESWNANKITLQRSAVADPTPENVAYSTAAIKRANSYMAAHKGLDADWLANQNLKDTTAMHVNAIAGMADNDAKGAKAYYQQYKEDIAPERRAGLEKDLDTANLLEATQERADELMTMGLDRGDAMAHIEKNFSGEDERNLKAEVIRRMNIAKAEIENGQQEAYEKAGLMAVQGQKVPPSLLAQMTDGQKASVIQTQRAEANRRAKLAAGKSVVTDPKLYARLRQIATDQPNKFSKMNLEEFVDRIAGKELEALLDRKDSIKADITTAAGKAKEAKETYLRTWSAAVTQRANVMELDPDKKAKFEMEADSALREAEERKGSPLDDAERTQLLDKLIIEGEVERGSWIMPDPDRRFFEVRGTKDEALFVPDIDDLERARIEAALSRAGEPVTDQRVMEVFRQASGL